MYTSDTWDGSVITNASGPILVCQMDGDIGLVEERTGMLLMQVQFPSVARDFLPESTFSADSYSVCTPPCAIACIYLCVHVKDSIVHVRIQWIMETLKHPACTIAWVAWLSQLAFPREGNLNFPWEKSHWNNTDVEKKKLKKKKEDIHACAQWVTLICDCQPYSFFLFSVRHSYFELQPWRG